MVAATPRAVDTRWTVWLTAVAGPPREAADERRAQRDRGDEQARLDGGEAPHVAGEQHRAEEHGEEADPERERQQPTEAHALEVEQRQVDDGVDHAQRADHE